MSVQILKGNRFRPLPGATVTKVAGNAYRVVVPKTPECERLAPAKWGIDAFDEAVLLIEERETMQVLGSSEGPDGLVLTALV